MPEVKVLMFKVWLVFSILSTACTRDNPRSCQDGTCTDPAYPYCDADGALQGERGVCIAVACSPGEFVACSSESEIRCNSAGDNYEVDPCPSGCGDGGCLPCTPTTTSCGDGVVNICGADGVPVPSESCEFGCLQTPTAHCAHLEPRYLPSICDAPGTGDFTIATAATLGTDLDLNCTGGVVQQSPGPDICVVRAHTINITSGGYLTGSGKRALALVADRSLNVEGTIDVSARGNISGPGGGTIASGGGPSPDRGGGGAGFGIAGAPGGSALSDGGAANGGAASMNPALLSVLIGGPYNGGGGGGALMLVSCRDTVSVKGVVASGGGGGYAGHFVPPNTAKPGNGGGAGGNVVIQGMDISVTGKLFANGGGGGGGKPVSQTAGNAGGDGRQSDVQAAAGGAAKEQEGAGGNGAIRALTPTVGRRPIDGTPGGAAAVLVFCKPTLLNSRSRRSHQSPSRRRSAPI